MDQNADVIICRCENVTLHTLTSTVQTYKCSAREIKLRTRAGMGYCGGRMCRAFINEIVGNHTQAHESTALTYRPPVRPVPFSVFGGDD